MSVRGNALGTIDQQQIWCALCGTRWWVCDDTFDGHVKPTVPTEYRRLRQRVEELESALRDAESIAMENQRNSYSRLYRILEVIKETRGGDDAPD